LPVVLLSMIVAGTAAASVEAPPRLRKPAIVADPDVTETDPRGKEAKPEIGAEAPDDNREAVLVDNDKRERDIPDVTEIDPRDAPEADDREHPVAATKPPKPVVGDENREAPLVEEREATIAPTKPPKPVVGEENREATPEVEEREATIAPTKPPKPVVGEENREAPLVDEREATVAPTKPPKPVVGEENREAPLVEEREATVAPTKPPKPVEVLPSQSCANMIKEFEYAEGKTTTCEAIGETRYKEMRKFWCDKYSIVSENCPGLCQVEGCECENNPFAFHITPEKRMKCSELADHKRVVKKCQRKKGKNKHARNCPGVCSATCPNSVAANA